MAERNVLLRLAGVGLRRGSACLLANVDLEMAAGERVVVLGANGAGKSTLLKVANGVIAPDRGQVAAPPRRAQALVFQRPAVLARSVLANVAFVLSVHGVPEPESSERARRALRACDLEPLLHRPARTLSGGEQQRLALACAWACEPALLFADEPTANLAPASVRAIEQLLLRLHSNGTALMMTTHNVAQARRMATRIVFIEAGCVVEDRPADAFFRGPESAAARSYLKGESL